MSKYKVGDRVVVISKEKIKYLTGSKVPFLKCMEKFCGETVTIKKVDDIDGTYRIDEFAFWWCDEFFEGLEKDVKRQYKHIDFPRIEHDKLLKMNAHEVYSELINSCNFADLYNFGTTGLDKLTSELDKLTSEKENNTMDKKDILAVRNYNDRAMVMQFNKKDKNGKNVQTRAEVHDGDTFDLDNGIRICLLKYLLGGHKNYMAIMDAARKSYKKTAKEDWKKLSEKHKKENEPIVEEIKKKSEKEKRDKEIEELIAKAIKKALAETGEEENKTVTE